MKKQIQIYIILGGVVVVIILMLILFMGGNSSSTNRQDSDYAEDSGSNELESSNDSSPTSPAPNTPKFGPAEELSFAPVLSALQQRNIEAANRELQKASEGSESIQIRMAAECFLDFYKEVMDELSRLQSVDQICGGEYSVIECKPPKKIIFKIDGVSRRFSFDEPVSHGYDLFEIMYRHLKMRAERKGSGNMRYDLGYAAYILFTEFADQAPAIKLLNTVDAQGSPKDREKVRALKNVFKIP